MSKLKKARTTVANAIASSQTQLFLRWVLYGVAFAFLLSHFPFGVITLVYEGF